MKLRHTPKYWPMIGLITGKHRGMLPGPGDISADVLRLLKIKCLMALHEYLFTLKRRLYVHSPHCVDHYKVASKENALVNLT